LTLFPENKLRKVWLVDVRPPSYGRAGLRKEVNMDTDEVVAALVTVIRSGVDAVPVNFMNHTPVQVAEVIDALVSRCQREKLVVVEIRIAPELAAALDLHDGQALSPAGVPKVRVQQGLDRTIVLSTRRSFVNNGQAKC
jgi:hypothetical protein